MKIPFSLLSGKSREETLLIPADPKDPSKGIGKVRAREIPPIELDDLWSRLIVAERRRSEAKQAAEKDRLNLELLKEFTLRKTEERAIQEEVIGACVVGHDSSSFRCEVPKVEPSDPTYQGILTILAGVGYSEQESIEACKTGTAEKRFLGISDACHFYRLCQPDGIFLDLLLFYILRFQRGEIADPVKIWKSNGVSEKDIPETF